MPTNRQGRRRGRVHPIPRNALCSTTRAAYYGRNHTASDGVLTTPARYPGYSARIPEDAPTLPATLRDVGYNTFAVGKWHLAPRWEQSASGPFNRWPLGLGFERYYGFLGGDTNQWTPNLVRDNGFVDQPRRPEEGYHLTDDLADEAIRLVLDQQNATGRPFSVIRDRRHRAHYVAWPRAIPTAAARSGWDSGATGPRRQRASASCRRLRSGTPSWVRRGTVERRREALFDA